MKIDNFVKIMICFVIFFEIFRTCESHFNRVSICTSRIRMSILDWIVFESILIVIVMSNFFEFLMKWISSYLIEANTNLCRIAHRSQSLCILSKFRQFFSMLFHKSKCWHRRRIREISCSFRICCTFLINQHYKANTKSKKTKIFAKFQFASKTIRSFFDSLWKSWSDQTKNC